MATFDLKLTGGTVHTPGGPVRADVGVRDGKIVAIGAAGDAGETIDCTGLDILPGVIDTQVHFREPGLVHKEDLESGSRAAVMGGVTAVFEMPNTKPNTDNEAAIADKLASAKDRMWCDHAFYVGATNANPASLAELERLPGTAGVKIFMGASTGDLLVSEDANLAAVLASGHRRVAIHAEDEDRMNARKDSRVAGDPASHPVWRDDESAMLATQRRRVHEAVVMKVLGATRARIAGIFACEFAALGLATALAALGVGTVAAYLVVSRLMGLQWAFLPTVAVAVALGAMVLTLTFGLAGTLIVLRQRPLALLRNE